MPADLGPLRIRITGTPIAADGTDLGTPIDLGIVEVPIRFETGPKPPISNLRGIVNVSNLLGSDGDFGDASHEQPEQPHRPTPGTIRHARRATFPAER